MAQWRTASTKNDNTPETVQDIRKDNKSDNINQLTCCDTEILQTIDTNNFKKQVIMETEILRTFFDAMNEMIDTNKILKGREFDIEMEKSLTTNNGNEILFLAETQILYLRINGSLKGWSFTNLSGYTILELPFEELELALLSHPSFLGRTSAHAFRWYNASDRTIRISQSEMRTLRTN
jgi:hypothetical protein